MKVTFLLALSLACSPFSLALPNAVGGFGGFAQVDSPLNGQDLTETLLSAGLWGNSTPLPGDWTAEAGVADTQAAYLMARPKVFDLDALFVRSLKREGKLEQLQITFADAGSFFGYLDRSLPPGMDKKEARAEMTRRLTVKQTEFSELYRERSESLSAKLAALEKRPKDTKRGRIRALRAELKQYRHGDLVITVLEAPDRLLRIDINRKGTAPKSWLDSSQEKLPTRDRLKFLEKQITRSESGDLLLPGVQVVPQGYTPYCGLNTLTMVGRYLGLHIDEDWLAVAGKFQNSGSAAGSDMLGLYNAVAKEAKFSMKRSSTYDHEAVRRSLRAGMPVIVWRRWSRDRDQLHTRLSRKIEKGESSKFPAIDESLLPSKKNRSPVHASVIVGYNDERKEILFLESWAGRATPRRMPIKEIAATADLTFCFTP